ncbi:MAG TPA: amino acid adenylation domain-containing protein, partial [Thermoanaerobaculia bacterium]
KASFTAPQGPVEELLAGIWAEVLRVESVGAGDNFFALGGHSLLATQVVSRVRAALGVELPLQRLFESPTIAALARAVEAARRDPRSPPPPLVALLRHGDLPLSFAQQRLWFMDRLEPGSTAYNLVQAVRLSGDLDAGALDRALAAVVARHESLRTRFGEWQGHPFQVVEAVDVERPFGPRRVDLRELPALPVEEREAEALRLLNAEALTPFDLAAGGLLRATLYTLGAREHLLALVIHHIVADGWSIGLLLDEIVAEYAAPSSLPPLPVQYADYAVWQRQWLAGETLAGEMDYWRRQLAGAPPLLELPTDRPRPAVQSYRGGTLRFRLAAGLPERVAALARGEGLTPFMALMAGFDALLARYSGQPDVVVGTPVANRRLVETEKLIGLFANTLVLRVDLADDPPFADLGRRVRQAALEAFARQDVPFERMVDGLEVERHLAYSPLFQVMFNLQTPTAGRVELPGLTLEPVETARSGAQFDLTLSLIQWENEVSGFLEYSSDLFDRATIERLLGHYQVLLAAAVETSERSVGELPLLTADERRQITEEWNDTAVAWPRETLIHELVERRAAARPEAWAVGFGAERLSYGELDARANRLARHLRRLGVGPEVLVGLCVERSAAMVVALLGILKAGGAYVPLDPSHPAERLGLVLADSAVPVLVTEEPLRGALPAHSARTVCLDRDAEAIARESARPLERVVDAETLAYVLYTSGSTGRPKGVGLPHRAVVNFLRAMAGRPGMGEGDVVPALTTLSFDIAGLEIYLPLMVGGRVEVLGREEAADGARLAGRLAAIGATVAQATPATWRLLIDAGWQGIAGLKVLCGGEALPRELASALQARGAELWNVYGPTETAVWSAAGEVAAGDGTVPLGRPIANTAFYVVDRDLEPVPIGVAGELLIGGEGLCRGYLHRPDLTAEKLVPQSFPGKVAGARVYRTGDLVRYRPSGELEFLGRIDHQVKVRGFRIELGEIEAALGRLPGVRQAVVTVREDGGDKRLVAYLVAEGEAPAAAELRRHLRGIVPEYMVPAAFVPLAAFPLTPSGKVDRRALPAPEASAAAEGYSAPQGPVEELLAGIWAEVLRVERVGARDNFFALGGHSLLATQVVSRVRVALSVELPLQRLFEAPTVSALARAVEAARQASAGAEASPIVPVPRDVELPLSFAQERMWFLHQLEPLSSAYNLASAVRLEGELDVPALARCFTEMARRHETLRTRFAAVDGRPVQVIGEPAEFELPLVDCRGIESGEEVKRRILDESARPFDLAAGPLLRATLLRTGEREHALLLMTHHIASDGWSMALMVGELADLYAAFAAGRPSPLPELPVQYADFAAWQRRRLVGEELTRQVGYWKGRLAGAPPLLELPADRPRPAVQSFRGARHRLSLPPDLVRALEAFARREGLTPFMVLMAAFQVLLGRYTSQDDVVVGTPIANRTRTEIERLIGFFVNTLVVRTGMADAPPFVELARRVRAAALEAYDHQDLPFEKLVDELRPERHLSYPPLFQVMFILQNAPVSAVDLAGLKMLPLEADRGQAPFDLTLSLIESGESWIGSLEYVTDLFDAATVARWAGHFEVLLRGIAAAPERPIQELPLLGPVERAELLTGWNDTAIAWPRETLIHELVERRAAARPEAWAVGFGAERLSYGELDARANRLARHLRRLGVGPEVLVGLCVERSAAMVVALLGILKAGGAYVPLDPSHPAERLGMVLADSA